MPEYSIFEFFQSKQTSVQTLAAEPPRIFLEKEVLKPLHRLQPIWFWAAFCMDWLVIFAAAWIYTKFLPFSWYPLAVFIIASRQQALGILAHEAVHFGLSRNRLWNDLLGDWLLALPLFITIEGYRREHSAHHKNPGSDFDPDMDRLRSNHYKNAQTRRGLISKMSFYFCGLYAIRDLIEYMLRYQLAVRLSWSTNFSRALFLIFAVSTISFFGAWKELLLFWVVPMCTALLAILYFRLKAEHESVAPEKWFQTRNIHASTVEKFFLAPHNVNLHLDHHLFPGVPFYNLPKLHARLVKEDLYRSKGQQTQGYLTGLIAEICSK